MIAQQLAFQIEDDYSDLTMPIFQEPTPMTTCPRCTTALRRKTAGEPLEVLRWQSRFIKGAFASDVETAALSVARGNGKTTLVKDRMYTLIATVLRDIIGCEVEVAFWGKPIEGEPTPVKVSAGQRWE